MSRLFLLSLLVALPLLLTLVCTVPSVSSLTVVSSSSHNSHVKQQQQQQQQAGARAQAWSEVAEAVEHLNEETTELEQQQQTQVDETRQQIEHEMEQAQEQQQEAETEQEQEQGEAMTSDTEAEVDTEADVDTEAEADASIDTEAESETEVDTEADVDAESAADIDAESESATETEASASAETDTEASAEAEAEAFTSMNTAAAADVDTGAVFLEETAQQTAQIHADIEAQVAAEADQLAQVDDGGLHHIHIHHHEHTAADSDTENQMERERERERAVEAQAEMEQGDINMAMDMDMDMDMEHDSDMYSDSDADADLPPIAPALITSTPTTTSAPSTTTPTVGTTTTAPTTAANTSKPCNDFDLPADMTVDTPADVIALIRATPGAVREFCEANKITNEEEQQRQIALIIFKYPAFKDLLAKAMAEDDNKTTTNSNTTTTTTTTAPATTTPTTVTVTTVATPTVVTPTGTTPTVATPTGATPTVATPTPTTSTAAAPTSTPTTTVAPVTPTVSTPTTTVAPVKTTNGPTLDPSKLPFFGDSVPAEILALIARYPQLGTDLLNAAEQKDSNAAILALLTKYPELADIVAKIVAAQATATVAPTVPSVLTNPTSVVFTPPTPTVATPTVSTPTVSTGVSDVDLYRRGRWTGRRFRNNTGCSVASPAKTFIHYHHQHHHHNHHHTPQSYGLIKKMRTTETSAVPDVAKQPIVRNALGQRLFHHHHHHQHHHQHRIDPRTGVITTINRSSPGRVHRALRRQFANHARHGQFWYDRQCNKHVFMHVHHQHHIHYPQPPANVAILKQVQNNAEIWLNKIVPRATMPRVFGRTRTTRTVPTIRVPTVVVPTIRVPTVRVPTFSPPTVRMINIDQVIPRPTQVAPRPTHVHHHHHHHHHVIAIGQDGRPLVSTTPCQQTRRVRTAQRNVVVYFHQYCRRSVVAPPKPTRPAATLPPVNSYVPEPINPRTPTLKPWAPTAFPYDSAPVLPTLRPRRTVAPPTLPPTKPVPTQKPYYGPVIQPAGPAQNGPVRPLTTEEARRTPQGVVTTGIVSPIQVTKLQQRAAAYESSTPSPATPATPATPARGPVIDRATGGAITNSGLRPSTVAITNGAKPAKKTLKQKLTEPFKMRKQRRAEKKKKQEAERKKKQEEEDRKKKQDKRKLYGQRSPRPSGLVMITEGVGSTQSGKILEYSNGQRVIYCNISGIRISAWTRSTGALNETAPMFYDTDKNPIVYSVNGVPLRYVAPTANSPTPYFDAYGLPLVYDAKKTPMVIKNTAAAQNTPMFDGQGKALQMDAKGEQVYYKNTATSQHTGIIVSITVAVFTVIALF